MSENLSNKTCGECRFYAKETEHCKLKGIGWKFATDTPCSGFTPRKPITNGDIIRQMSNEEFAKLRVYQCPPVPAEFCKGTDTVKCVKCWLNWLNAPAESEGE